MKKSISTYFFLSAILFLAACSGKSASDERNPGETTIMASQVATGLEIGQRAPDITLAGPDGKHISLSSLRGKMVLIDFWASWCPPCRMENPNLVHVYKKYNNKRFARGKGFSIFSVSLDTDRDAWLKAIKDDGLEWNSHVSDLKGWNASPAMLYNVKSIPANFLVDADGIIVAKDLREESLVQTMESLVR